MRTVSQNFIDDLTTSRVIGANAVFRDLRLRFTYANRRSNDDELNAPSYDQYNYAVKSIDSCLHGTGILRVANVNGSLKYMYLSSLPSWPASWTLVNTGLMTGSGIGIHSGRCFYQKADGKIYYRNFTSGSPGTETSFGSAVYSPCGIAPVSTTEIFLLERVNANYAKLRNTNGTTVKTFEGRIYEPSPTTALFDAETLDGTSYLFFATEYELRPWMVSYRGGNWSQVTPVIPLDVVDDETGFRMSGVELINNEIVLTGVRTSATGDDWLFYSFGPSWTMGRDCFIGKEGSQWDIDENAHGIPPWGGKMHLLSSTVYIIAPSVMYSADATYLLGVDNAAYKKDMGSDVRKINTSFRIKEPSRLTLDIPASTTHQAIRVGSDLDVSVSVGGHSATLCKYNVDAIAKSIENDAQTKTILATSKGLKNLTRWAPDLNYDMWAQGKSCTNPATLTEVIRINGDWEVDETKNAITLHSLNERGIMYSTVRPSRNAIVQGTFKFDQELANHDLEFGLLLNYYRETKEQAMARLGKTEDEIRWWDYGDNGLAVVWGTKVYDPFGTPGEGFGIYWFYDNTWFTTSYNWSANLNQNTWYEVQAEFFEGNIRVLYRIPGQAAWTLVGNAYIFESSSDIPWSHAYSGRAGLYMNNITPHSGVPTFNQETLLIPVTSNGTLPENETYIIDDEQLTITTKTINRTGPENMVAREGYTLDGAPHDNPYQGPFSGYEIYFQGSTAQTNHNYFDNLALVVTKGQGMGNVYKVTDFDYVAPDQWVPSQTYTLPDTWMDHIGDPTHGSWQTDTTLRRIFVETDPEGDIGNDSEFEIRPALICTQRGANGTLAVGHSTESEIHVYKPDCTWCKQFNVFTGDIDTSVSDVFYELERRAGNLTPNISYIIDGAQSGYGWNWDTAYDNGTHQADFVCKMRRITDDAEIGVMFHLIDNGTMEGSAITVTNTHVNLYHTYGGGTPSIQVPIDNNPKSSWITFSIDKGKYSVWINNRLVAVFYSANVPEIGDISAWEPGSIHSNFYCPSGSSVYVKWPLISGRVDNFIMDMGKGGGIMLDRLIGDKRIFFCDDQNGNTKLFRVGETIPGSFSLAVAAGETGNEQDLVTRARVEGMEAWEVADETAMKENGNLFRNYNNEEVTSWASAADEAQYIIELGGKKTSTVMASGAGDPRVEPGDKMNVVLPSGTYGITVDGVTYKLDIDRRNAIFDMTVEGY